VNKLKSHLATIGILTALFLFVTGLTGGLGPLAQKIISGGFIVVFCVGAYLAFYLMVREWFHD
jgi:hypothetical protein